MEMEPSADEIATIDARQAAFETLERQDLSLASLNRTNSSERYRFMSVDEVASRGIVDTEVVRQVADRFGD